MKPDAPVKNSRDATLDDVPRYVRKHLVAARTEIMSNQAIRVDVTDAQPLDSDRLVSHLRSPALLALPGRASGGDKRIGYGRSAADRRWPVGQICGAVSISAASTFPSASIMETAINGVTKLLTSFNLDNPSHVTVTLHDSYAAVLWGHISGRLCAQAGGEWRLCTDQDRAERLHSAVQQMGNMGGGLRREHSELAEQSTDPATGDDERRVSKI